VARAGLTPDTVTDLALTVLDEAGEQGLTLRAVAERAGVATPSLYKHVPSLARLRQLMALRTLGEATERIGTAVMGRAGEDALRAFLAEYRAFAREYPHRQALIERVPGDDPDVSAASERLVRIAYAVVRGFGLEGDEAVHAVRTLRAAVVGFAGLERGGDRPGGGFHGSASDGGAAQTGAVQDSATQGGAVQDSAFHGSAFQDSAFRIPVDPDDSFEFLTRVLARGLREGAGASAGSPPVSA
jgi:AcrR family transcriptional regulator